MKKTFLFLFLCFACATAVPVQDAVALALSNNYTIQAAQASRAKANEEYNASFRRLFPTLSLDSSYKYVSDVSKITMPGGPGQPAKEVEMGVHDTYDNGLTLSWLLFNGFAKESAVAMQKAKQTMAEAAAEKTRREIGFKTISAYYSAMALMLQEEQLQAGKTRAMIQRDKIKSLVDNGMGLKLDYLTMALAVDQYDQQILSARASRQLAVDQLRDLVGVSLSIQTIDPRVVTPTATFVVDGFPEWQSIVAQESLVQSAKAMAGAKNYPDLSIAASTRRGKPGVNPIDNEWMNYQTAGVSAQWNVWDWGARTADTTAQDQEALAVAAQKKSLVDSLQTKYAATVRDYNTMQEQLNVLANSVSVAREKMAIVQEQAKSGVVSATDFRDANEELTQTEMKYRQQKILLANKAAEVAYASGAAIETWRL